MDLHKRSQYVNILSVFKSGIIHKFRSWEIFNIQINGSNSLINVAMKTRIFQRYEWLQYDLFYYKENLKAKHNYIPFTRIVLCGCYVLVLDNFTLLFFAFSSKNVLLFYTFYIVDFPKNIAKLYLCVNSVKENVFDKSYNFK